MPLDVSNARVDSALLDCSLEDTDCSLLSVNKQRLYAWRISQSLKRLFSRARKFEGDNCFPCFFTVLEESLNRDGSSRGVPFLFLSLSLSLSLSFFFFSFHSASSITRRVTNCGSVVA